MEPPKYPRDNRAEPPRWLTGIFTATAALFLLSAAVYAAYTLTHGMLPAFILNLLSVAAALAVVIAHAAGLCAIGRAMELLAGVIAANICASIIIEAAMADSGATLDIYFLLTLAAIPFLLSIIAGARWLSVGIVVCAVVCFCISCHILRCPGMYTTAGTYLLPCGLCIIFFERSGRVSATASPPSDTRKEVTRIMKTLYPALTRSELNICWLVVTGKSVSEICHIRHVSSSTVTSTRSRLRQKLGLEKNEILQDFLTAIIEQKGIDIRAHIAASAADTLDA